MLSAFHYAGASQWGLGLLQFRAYGSVLQLQLCFSFGLMDETSEVWDGFSFGADGFCLSFFGGLKTKSPMLPKTS